MQEKQQEAIQYLKRKISSIDLAETEREKLEILLALIYDEYSENLGLLKQNIELLHENKQLKKGKQKLEAKMVSKIKELHISDIEPWSTYKIQGKWLIDVAGYFI